MIVYKVTNLLNNKIYIGKSKINSIEYLGSGKLIKQAIKKYGKSNFIKETLEHCKTIKQLNNREKFWISSLNSQDRNIGYNIADGGDGGDTFTMRSKKDQTETRKKIKINQLNMSNLTIEKHRVNTTNLWKDPNFRDKVIARKREVESQPLFKEKFSKKMKEVCSTEKNRKIKSDNSKGSNNSKWLGFVYLYDTTGKLIKRYECLKYLRKDYFLPSKTLNSIRAGENNIIIESSNRKKLNHSGFSIRIVK